ncbi:MAG: flagellar biosynthesis protein FlhF [Treponema sp.]|jgi:flagellar biosynthesis protein FlhF|nr:flagellar biosynthesis protein FlhF [Treponema sp.]
MEMYIEQGLSRMDCELKIAEKYKRPFHILSQKPVKLGGFLGFFAKSGVEVQFYFSSMLNKNQAWRPASDEQPLRELWQSQQKYPAEQVSRKSDSDLEEAKKKLLATAAKSQEQAVGRETSQQILASLKEIKEKIDSGGKEHPAFTRASQLLRLNDFSENYIDGMLERLRKELPLDTLEDDDAVQDKLLEWVGESISIYTEEENNRILQRSSPRKTRVMVLVGPTGVGKTTTIAKLAAIYGIETTGKPAVDVRMITIDAFRIGAKAQLESYGDIMHIPVSCVDNKQDLRKEIALYSEDTDLFLIDTIGKSPKDSAKLGEIKEILDGCPRGTLVHLVLSASTKTSDIEDAMRQFEPFNYKSIVLTKLDETNHVGNVISALAEKGKSVSFITDGQKVPNDIRKATVVRFLINLDDFKVDRNKIEKRFPSGEADQFMWS